MIIEPDTLSIREPDFEATVALEGLELRMSGNADTRIVDSLHALVGELHAKLHAEHARHITVDLSRLEFMNASCFNVLVNWLQLVAEARAGRALRAAVLDQPGHPVAAAQPAHAVVLRHRPRGAAVTGFSFPDELINQFRAVALERLTRIETAWAQVLSVLDEEAAAAIYRELHTLKGESNMLGYNDVNLVSHKLEDLLDVARARGYAVDEDFDLIVNMAVRFMAMLVRKKAGAKLGGIDLPGFVAQIDALLAEIRPHEPRRATGSFPPMRVASAPPRVSPALRARLEPVAVDSYIEYAVARRARRDRLRASWHALRELVGMQRALVGPSQLAKHRDGAVALARELGKQVQLTFDVDTVEATAAILAAVDTAVLHLVRNAIDHGLEPPTSASRAARRRTGRCASSHRPAAIASP